MRYAKGHGTGNDFIIVPDVDGRLDLRADLVRRLCDRHTGIGADGVLRVVSAEASRHGGEPGVADWFMDYRNADGSIAEMCGNGIRVFARCLVDRGLARWPAFTVATRAGPREVRQAPGGDITASMGTVEVAGPAQAVVGGRAVPGLRVGVGNPHLACLVDAPLESFDLSEPPALDPDTFPRGANVELVRATGASSVEMRVHERGSGETRSCGTGAVAAAVAAARAAGQDATGGVWRVRVPGGRLAVALDRGAAWLTGPAVLVATGEIDAGWLAGGRLSGT